MTQEYPIYEDAKDTAKKIRKALKEAFPGAKFSVTSSTYSMGSSVYVKYTGGEPVDHNKGREICRSFASSKFDSMTDYKEITGYEYEGKIYSGADYILYS